jgi:hypothetical protein
VFLASDPRPIDPRGCRPRLAVWSPSAPLWESRPRQMYLQVGVSPRFKGCAPMESPIQQTFRIEGYWTCKLAGAPVATCERKAALTWCSAEQRAAYVAQHRSLRNDPSWHGALSARTAAPNRGIVGTATYLHQQALQPLCVREGFPGQPHALRSSLLPWGRRRASQAHASRMGLSDRLQSSAKRRAVTHTASPHPRSIPCTTSQLSRN